MIKRTWRYRLALVVPVFVVSAGPVGATPTAAALEYAGAAASASQALTLVNQERVRAGCASLWIAARLQTPAARQSWDQAARDGFGHDGTNGSTVDTRLSGLGYSRWGENVVQSQSAHAAVNFWSKSPRHRANMLNCVFRQTGLAVDRSNSGKLYWTQTFGG
ncbi:MAG: CAP domain-containing protein [Pseudonocardiaceae bacterium]